MNTPDAGGGQETGPDTRAPLHGAHQRTLEAVFRHPVAHNLAWLDVIALLEKIGVVHRRHDDKFTLDLAGQHYVMKKPHGKDLTSSEVSDLRHFLQRAGWSAAGASPAPATAAATPLSLLVAVDHHGARLYRIDGTSATGAGLEIKPYDPHHFLHHLTHKDQSREQGQRAPEDFDFYERIAAALVMAGRIVVVGHGAGKSNAAIHLLEYLRTHRRETYAKVVRELEADLSAVTTAQLLKLAEQALSAPTHD
jgi:hypothetical protein